MNKQRFLMSILSVTMILGTAHVFAGEQQPLTPDEPKPVHLEKMMQQVRDKFAERLKLTDEQKKQAEDIRKKGREQMKPLMDEMMELRKKMDKARQENMREFENILTDEQKAELKKFKEEQIERFKKHRRKFGKRHFRPHPKK